MKALLRFILVWIVVGRLLTLPVNAQPPPPANVSLTVDKTTGAIVGPISAATFKSANAISSGGTVTSVAMTVPAFLSVAGSPVTTTGTLALSYSGTALPVANGGSGATSLTAAGLVVANGTSAFTTLSGSSSGHVATWNGTAWTSAAPTGGVSASGTPSSGQAAEWVSSSAIQGVNVVGSGNYVKDTSPTFAGNITLATGTSPTTGAAGATAFDTNAWASGRGAAQLYDGTANTYVVGVLASDSPSNGQVPTWNTGGTITWETPSGSGNVTGSSLTANAVVVGAGSNAIGVLASLGTSGQPLVSAGAGAPPAFGTLGVSGGGTGLTSGTSGGIPYFSSSSAITSSAALASSNIVVGGGAGAAPVTRPVTVDSSGNSIFGASGAANITANVVTANNITVTDFTTTNLTVSGALLGATAHGQIYIGNTTNGAFIKNTITGTSGNITVTNGASSITLNLGTTGVSAATYGSATASPQIAVDTAGRITSASNVTITPAVGSITGFGTGVATALAVNTGSAGAFVVNGGALGTPSSGTLTNASGLPIAGLVNSTSTGLGVGSIYLGHASDTQVYRASSGVVAINSEIVATDVNTLTLTGKQVVDNGALGTDDTWTGSAINGRQAGATIAQWEAVYMGSSSKWLLADANGSGTYPARGLAAAAYVDTNSAVIITRGTIRNDAWNFTPGGTIYLSTTAGGLTQTAPSTSGDKVQQIGYALTADIIFVDFASGEYLTVQ